MGQYKVIALSVGSGRGKRIYKSGDIVTESGFHPGMAEELVLKGFLKPIGDDHQDNQVKDISFEKTLPPSYDKDVNENDFNIEQFKKEELEEKAEFNELNEDLKAERFKNGDLGQKVLDSINNSKQKDFPKFDDVTKNAIIEHLKNEKINFDHKESKEVLYSLWVTKSKAI